MVLELKGPRAHLAPTGLALLSLLWIFQVHQSVIAVVTANVTLNLCRGRFGVSGSFGTRFLLASLSALLMMGGRSRFK